jgi:hypothetical protein
MQHDHYIAQTYLRHFTGPSGMLRAYRKSNGATFRCRPKAICHEPNGDIIPDFLSEPGYLGEYRAGFEPLWNSGVAALEARSLDKQDFTKEPNWSSNEAGLSLVRYSVPVSFSYTSQSAQCRG